MSRKIFIAAMLGGLVNPGWAQGGIYTCIDAHGRRLTADRPILECNDREQKELNTNGTLRRRVAPALTAEERFAEEEKARKQQEDQFRIEEQKRRDRALLSRYPRKETHDRERAAALAQADQSIAISNKNVAELNQLRKQLMAETEFYKSPAQWPQKLQRELEQNQLRIDTEKRFITQQQNEKQRIGTRFDEELVRLQVLWTLRAQTSGSGGSASSAGSGR